MTSRVVLLLPFVALLAGCIAPIRAVVRDPKTGQVEACLKTFSVSGMTMKGRCTDGSSVEAKLDSKKGVVARDGAGNVVTCGPSFNGAICWPSANARPRRCEDDGLVSKGDWCVTK